MNQNTLYKNARIFCPNSLSLFDGEFKVDKKGTIISVTRYDDSKELGESSPLEGSTVYDCERKVVTPGCLDSHAHLWKVGQLKVGTIDLRNAKSTSEIKSLIKDYISKNPDKPWITARGFNEEKYIDKKMPTGADLDEISTSKAIFVQRTCAHIAVVNSAALKACQIGQNPKQPDGGSIELDAHGFPTGVLAETALGLVTKNIPTPTDEELMKGIIEASNEFLSHGITGVCDPGLNPHLLNIYKTMDKEKKLPVRVQAMALHFSEDGKNLNPLEDVYKTDFLRIDVAKYYADGGLSGSTAAVNEPYPGTDNNTGILRFEKASFHEATEIALSKGYGVATHAIGDRAIDFVLDEYKSKRSRYKSEVMRVEHCGVPSLSNLDDISGHSFYVTSQPIFLKELGVNFVEALGTERLSLCYPGRSYLNKKITVGFSSDAPVVKDISAKGGILSAISRKLGNEEVLYHEESVTAAEALTCYTRESAKVMGLWDITGSVETGKKADFVIWENNPSSDNLEDIEKARVLETYVNGKLAYKAK